MRILPGWKVGYGLIVPLILLSQQENAPDPNQNQAQPQKSSNKAQITRIREIATRIALGAPVGHVATLVLRRSMLTAFAGLTLGELAFLVSKRAMASVFGLTVEVDYQVLLAGSLILGGTALVATIVPLRRAFAIAPSHVLRS